MLHLDPSPVSGVIDYGDANGPGLVHLGYDATWRRHCRIGAIVDGSPCLVEVRFPDLAPDPFAPDGDAEAVRAATRRLMSIIRLHANGFETVLPLLGPSSRIADDWAASLDPDMRAAYGDPVGLTLYLAAPGVSARAEGRGDDDALAEALADRWPDVGTHVEIHHDRFGGSEDIVIGQVARWLQAEPIDVVEAMRAAARIANGARRSGAIRRPSDVRKRRKGETHCDNDRMPYG